MKKLAKILKIMQMVKLSGGSPLKRRAIKLLILGAFFLLIAIVSIFIAVVVFVINNYEQIYQWFVNFIHFVFGGSPESLWRRYLQLIIDGFINNLLRG